MSTSQRSRKRERATGRKEEHSFLKLCHFVIRHPKFMRLSPRAKAVFLALAAQYNGGNNGQLAIPRTQHSANGFGENGNPVKHGIEELIAAGFVICTRPGKLRVGPSLYAITTEPMDESHKHPYPKEHKASHIWREKSLERNPCTTKHEKRAE